MVFVRYWSSWSIRYAKISLFLNGAGAEAQEIFGTFTFVGETEDPKKYADVINKFTNFVCTDPGSYRGRDKLYTTERENATG